MENPWIDFVGNLDYENLVLDNEKNVVKKFNERSNEKYKIIDIKDLLISSVRQIVVFIV